MDMKDYTIHLFVQNQQYGSQEIQTPKNLILTILSPSSQPSSTRPPLHHPAVQALLLDSAVRVQPLPLLSPCGPAQAPLG